MKAVFDETKYNPEATISLKVKQLIFRPPSHTKFCLACSPHFQQILLWLTLTARTLLEHRMQYLKLSILCLCCKGFLHHGRNRNLDKEDDRNNDTRVEPKLCLSRTQHTAKQDVPICTLDQKDRHAQTTAGKMKWKENIMLFSHTGCLSLRLIS